MSPQAILFFIAVLAIGAFFFKMEDRPGEQNKLTAFDRRVYRPNAFATESSQAAANTTGEEGTRFRAGRPPSIG